MGNLINIEYLKNHSYIDKNVENKYLTVALETIHLTMLDDILGHCLYDKLEELICSGDITLPENAKYFELIRRYIVPLVAALVQYEIALPITFKERNAGVSSPSDSTFRTASSADIQRLLDFYKNRANQIQIKLIEFLRCHYEDFPELNCPDECDDAPCGECKPCCSGGRLLRVKFNLGFYLGCPIEKPTLRDELTSRYQTDVRYR